MERTLRATLFLLLIISLCAAQNATTTYRPAEFNVGVILDMDSLVGKVSRTSISLAVQDFYSAHQNYSTKLVIHFRDSGSSNVQAASAAIELLEKYKVQAIIGPQKSSEAAFISDLGNVTQVPIISFTATSPSLTSASMPYFVRATLNDSVQVSSITSLIKAYGWREVILVYDDTEYGRGILPHLIDALQQIDARVPYHSVIPLSATSDNIVQELYKLKTMQTRVFIVHMSSIRASLLFTAADEAGMINKGFVWIITMGLANILDSLSPSVVEAMNGVIGVKFHVPKSQEHDTSFLMRWNRMYELDNPNESALNKLSIVGLWGYDTVWALAQAAEKVGVPSNKNKRLHPSKNSTFMDSLTVSTKGPELLTEIVQNKFRGLSGNFDLTDKKLQVSALQIINVVGGRCRCIGFWTLRNGLSRQLNTNGLKITGSASLFDLSPVIWPGESTEIPRGWDIPASGNKLRVGVHRSAYPEFVWTSRDPATNKISVSGLSIEVFEEAVNRLPFALSYEYEAFDTVDTTSSRSNDDFVHQVYLQRYDIAIGDTTIRYNRTFYVDFTVPYTESGMAMIVASKTTNVNNMWIFLKPLSKGMWFGSIMLFIYTGVVIWMLERLNGSGYLHGPFSLKQLGILIFFSVSEEKEKLECLLSRIVLLVWMFVLLVFQSSYTGTFASMLTVQQLSPTLTDIHELQKQGGYVGFGRGSFIESVLLQDIGFDRSRIRPYDTPDDFHSALSNGSVAAIVLEVPYIKLFLAKYCKGYTMAGPIYKSSGFAFALPKRSPLVAEISRAIINITGGDSIIQIENKWINHQNRCQNGEKIYGSDAISFGSFGGLFLLTGCVTTSSLCVALLMKCYRKDRPKPSRKIDDSNQPKQGRQRENGDTQDGDQSNEENGGCNAAENQATVISVSHSSNTNGDLPLDCTQNNMAAESIRFGSQVIHRENKVTMPPSSSSLLTSEPSEPGGVDVTSEVLPEGLVNLGSRKNLLQK